MFGGKGSLGKKGFPCLCVPDKCSCTAVLLCKLLGTPGCRTDAGALAWRHYKLLVTKREKIFFSAQLRLKTSLSELCWGPHACLWGWWCLALSSLAANSGSKPWGGC